MTRWRAVVGLAMMAACSGGGPGAEAPAPVAVTSAPFRLRPIAPIPELPATLLGYVLEEASPSANREEGTTFRYRNAEGRRFDMFVYPTPFPEGLCHQECAQGLVHTEADGFGQSLDVLVEVGYYDNVNVSRDRELSLDGRPVRARHLVLDVVSDGDAGWSAYLVTVVHGFFVKLRMTDVTGTAENDLPVRLFRRAVEGIQPNWPCVHGRSSNENQPSMSTTVGGPADDVVSRIGFAFDSLGYELQFAQNGLWTSRIVTDWPQVVPVSQRTGVAPGYQLAVQITQAEHPDSLQLSIVAPTICNLPRDPDGVPASTIQLGVAMEASRAMTGRQ